MSSLCWNLRLWELQCFKVYVWQWEEGGELSKSLPPGLVTIGGTDFSRLTSSLVSGPDSAEDTFALLFQILTLLLSPMFSMIYITDEWVKTFFGHLIRLTNRWAVDDQTNF